jgi:hypothetical protein
MFHMSKRLPHSRQNRELLDSELVQSLGEGLSLFYRQMAVGGLQSSACVISPAPCGFLITEAFPPNFFDCVILQELFELLHIEIVAEDVVHCSCSLILRQTILLQVFGVEDQLEEDRFVQVIVLFRDIESSHLMSICSLIQVILVCLEYSSSPKVT